MKRALSMVCVLGGLGLLGAGCMPKAEPPPLDAQAAEAKKMPGADTPPAATTGDPNAAKRAKEDK